jgi:hypothetical protein
VLGTLSTPGYRTCACRPRCSGARESHSLTAWTRLWTIYGDTEKVDCIGPHRRVKGTKATFREPSESLAPRTFDAATRD